jgi:DNA-binding response OmpR family regulator
MIKILIVEDDNHLRQILSKYLIQIGYDVLTAFDGLNALNLLEHQKVDLVVTDVMMPHIDGNELSYTLRQMFPEMPILMLTALDQYRDKEKGFLSGVDDYLIKPIDLKELNLRIQAILRRYHIMVSHRIKLKHVILDQK